jgi:hypothetical protein
MSESNNSTQAYVFGHSVGEAQSIQLLARILAPVTRQFLEQAGLCAGLFATIPVLVPSRM